MNYMDYGADGCINMFSGRQVQYMHLILSTLRQSLYNSSGLTGTDQVGERSALSIYPNPSGGRFIVEAQETMDAELWTLEGRMLGTFFLDRGQNRMDFSMLSEGIYVLKTVRGVHRMVIQH